MATLEAVMSALKAKSSEKTRATYVRHGSPLESALGVSVADLKLIAKPLKHDQALARALYDTGTMEGMYLAGMIANGAQMTRKQLQSWVEHSQGISMISDYTVPWVTVEHPEARALALEWIASSQEHVAASGWCTYSGLVTTQPDAVLDLKEIQGLLKTIASTIHTAPNHVRSTMNSFVIAVGTYVTLLANDAKKTAEQMGVVHVDVGDTACKVPDALVSIAKVEARGSAGVKRKTIRC
jgi:3-methyladenine DNA glycosylase AlkD